MTGRRESTTVSTTLTIGPEERQQHRQACKHPKRNGVRHAEQQKGGHINHGLDNNNPHITAHPCLELEKAPLINFWKVSSLVVGSQEVSNKLCTR